MPLFMTSINPNVADLLRQKPLRSRDSPAFGGTAALGRELGPNGARLSQDFTYGEVRFVLTEPVRNQI